MSDFVKTVLSELARFISPLSAAIQDEQALEHYLLRFGYSIDVTALGGAVNSLGPLATAAGDLIAQVDSDVAQGGIDNIDVGAVIALAQASFTNLDDFGDAFSSLQDLAGLPNKAENLGKLPGDVLAALLTDYLRDRADTGLRVLQFLGVHETVSVLEQTDPRWRGAIYHYSRYNWTRLGQLFRDPEGWGRKSWPFFQAG